jgi:hypothetical protein
MAVAPKVFVVDAEGKPLLPTHPARARKLIRAGKAVVLRIVPYTIQLSRVVDNPVGSFSIGIDDGAKEVGLSVVNEHTQEVVFRGTVRLRQDVSRKMTQRSQYRRARRSRNLRHREARFDNRGKRGWLPPSIRQKKDSILRVVNDLKTLLNITRAVVEQGQFDTSSMAAGDEKTGVEYQIPDYEGRSFRAKVLWRDRYTCQHCGSKDNLRAHHIRLRSQGGTNTPRNGITLCEPCHDGLHQGLWSLTARPRDFKYPAHLQAGKWYLYNGLKGLGLAVDRCCGWMTSFWRNSLGLSKGHTNDAAVMVCRTYVPRDGCGKDCLIIPRRKKVWEDNPTKTCVERSGFRHWDLVKAYHCTKGWVVGAVRSLKAESITLRASWDDNFPVSYKKSRVLWRPDGVVYV